MRRFSLIILCSLLMAVTVSAQEAEKPASRTDSIQAVAPTVAPDAAAVEAARVANELRKAMNVEIHARVETTQTAVAALVAELETVATPEQRLEIQRRIQATKESERRDLLLIQLDYAQQGGHHEQARELETRLTRMDETAAKVLPQASTRGTRRGGESR